jgi:hypothetical protein
VLAEGEGLAWRTVERAKRELGVFSERVGELGGKGHWQWWLTNPATVTAKAPEPFVGGEGALSSNPAKTAMIWNRRSDGATGGVDDA